MTKNNQIATLQIWRKNGGWEIVLHENMQDALKHQQLLKNMDFVSETKKGWMGRNTFNRLISEHNQIEEWRTPSEWKDLLKSYK